MNFKKLVIFFMILNLSLNNFATGFEFEDDDIINISCPRCKSCELLYLAISSFLKCCSSKVHRKLNNILKEILEDKNKNIEEVELLKYNDRPIEVIIEDF